VPTLEELHAQLDKAEALLKYRTGKVTAWSRQVELAKAEVARLKKEIADRPVPARGIDISNRQGHVDFAKVKAAGNRFVWLKAGEGDWKDPLFLENVKAAKAAGLKVGAYQFLRPKPGRTGAQEAAFFIARLWQAALGGNDLLPAADIEDTALGKQATLDYTWDFLTALKRAGYKPCLYTYPSFLAAPGQKLGDWGARFKTWPLWLASYQTQTPTPPKPWTSFVAWQYSSKGTVAGVSGAVDMNRTDDLRRLIA
jgi:lysozyme